MPLPAEGAAHLGALPAAAAAAAGRSGERRGIVPSGGRRPHSPAAALPRGPSPAGGAQRPRARCRRPR